MTQPGELPPQQDVPPDATAAAEAEMSRLDAAAKFHPTAPGIPPLAPRGYQVPMTSPAFGYQSPEMAPAPPRPGSMSSLEDLYAAYPNIGDGNYKLRVYRIWPKQIGGTPTEGWLDDLDEQISLHAFQERYGGGRYKITVLGPGRRMDREGNTLPQTLANLELQLQGNPSKTSLPKREEPFMMGMPGGGMPGYAPFYGSEPKEITQQRMLNEQRDKERMISLAAGQGGNPQLAQHTIDQMRLTYETHAQTTREQIKELLQTVSKMESSNGDLRNQLVEARSNAAKAEALERELRDLRSRSENDLQQLRTRYDADSTALRDRIERENASLRDRYETTQRETSDRHRQEINDLNQRHRDEMSREQGRYLEDRQKLAEAQSEKLQDYRTDAERRVADLERNHTRELQTLRDVHQREIATMQQSLDTRMEMNKGTSALQLDTLRGQITRLEEELRSTTEECEELRRQVHKPLAEQLNDAETVATKFLGLSRKNPEGDFDIKKEIAGLIKTGVEQAPVLMEKMGEMRQRTAEAAAAAQQQAVQQQMAQQQQQQFAMQQQQMQQRMVPPGMQLRQQQQRPQGPTPPQPPWGSAQQPWGPPGGIGAPGGPPLGVPPPPAPLSFRPFHIVQQPTTPAVPVEQAPAAAPVAAPPPVQASAQQTGVPSEFAPTDDQIVQALDALANAINGGMAPPQLFAQGLLDRIGPQRAAAMLQLISPERIFEMIEKRDHPPWRVIATRDGQQYVRHVWAIVGQIVMGAPAAQPQPVVQAAEQPPPIGG